MDLNRIGLHESGFEGFVEMHRLRQGSRALIPAGPGNYVVLVRETTKPEILASNSGGRFKDRDPTVSAGTLLTKWVGDASIVYVGTAKHLRRRISQLIRFGCGRRVGHWGGRYLWQLANAWDLTICWRSCPNPEQARANEAQLLRTFAQQYGCLPFANLRL